VKGEPVTRRTDVYAASVVLWEALTGRRLFKAENEANAIARVLAGQVPAVSSIVPGLSTEVDAVIARGIHLDPEARYATAREMVIDLERALPPAASGEVVEWVEKCAHADLTEQAKNVGEMERSDSETSWSLKAMRSVPELMAPKNAAKDTALAVTRVKRSEDPRSGVSSVSLSHTAPPASKPSSRTPKIAIAVAGALGVVVIVALAFALGKSSREPTRTTTTAAVPEAKTEIKLAATTPPTSAPAVTASPPTTGTSSNVPVVSISALPKATQVAAPPPVSTKGSDCNPPFTTDAKGHVHFKPQCM